jgi:Family of unknown function (DUF6220)
MRSGLRWLHAAAAWVFVAAVIVQVFLAGAAIVNLGGSGDFGTHIEFGYTAVGLAAIVVVITALLARAGGRQALLSFVLLVLYIVQTILPTLRTTSPTLAALHPVNALLVFGLGVVVARRALSLARQPDLPSGEAATAETGAAS